MDHPARIERAIPEDHVILTVITKSSKAYWGYPPAQLAQWETLLTITPGYISNSDTFRLVLDDHIVGYYSLVATSDGNAVLDNLFILPEFIGKGFGNQLMEHMLGYATQQKLKSISLDADPNAESFYARFGFITVGQTATSVPWRFLPAMRKAMQPMGHV